MRCAVLLMGAFFCVVAPVAARDDTRAREALLFAERRDWNNALAHARRADDETLLTLITWQYLLDADSGASFDAIAAFMREHPQWPEQKRLRLRAEMSLRDAATDGDAIIAWFAQEAPVSGIGKLTLAEALLERDGESGAAGNLIREAWVGGDFDEAKEKEILSRHGHRLTLKEDRDRVFRLLWEEKTAPAKRMLPRLPADARRLAQARIALIAGKRTAIAQAALLPAAAKKDPGLLYDRMRWHARQHDNEAVRAMLLAAPQDPPYPEKWWKYRELQVRLAIDEKHYAVARKLLNEHGQKDGQSHADALWLTGWLDLQFLDKPQDALAIFKAMHQRARYPVSRARAAYWAARAAERLDESASAQGWYAEAARHPTVFYGQLAALKTRGSETALKLSDQSASFGGGGDLAQAVALAADVQPDIASRLIAHLVETAGDDDEAAGAAALGVRHGHAYLSVRGAKKALQRDLVLLETGYPRPATPKDLSVERPLALAVARQESEFNPLAKSPSGALGMMQLLSPTAREMARKHGLGYRPARLYETAYNFTLGGLYLNRLVDAYGGSYPVAVAAYNAGPGNVSGWVRQFGMPGESVEEAVDWIEKIPFAETRNYVQRVLENLQVYRQLENSGQTLLLAKDLAG